MSYTMGLQARVCEQVHLKCIRLNRWQQATVALGSAVGTLLDPRGADLIAALGEPTGKPSFERVLDRMKKSPKGRIFCEVQTTGGFWEETTTIKGDAGADCCTRGINTVQQRPPRDFYNRVCK